MKLLDLLLLLVCRAFLVRSSLAWIPSRGQLIDKLVPTVQDFIHLSLFCEDLIAEGQRILDADIGIVPAAGILVPDFVDHQAAVLADSEQKVILIGEAHPIDRHGVCLYLR